jgi:hypothetical protein
MRALFLGLFVCALVIGCASHSPSPKKPSPCHYPQPALAQSQRL